MFEEKNLKKIKQKKDEWEKNIYLKHVKENPELKDKFENLSGIEIKNVYTPNDIPYLDYIYDINFPGEYPFLRGVHATM